MYVWRRNLDDLDAALRAFFPEHGGFLPGQRAALEGVLDKRDVIAVLPTGGGKTLVYQLAGVLLSGTTVVATPLIALLQDQVRRLSIDEAGPGRRVGWITGSVRGDDRQAVLAQLRDNELDFFFATPEQLTHSDVRGALSSAHLDLFCVDEAHCISEWGFDFRPAYRELAAAAKVMGRPPVLALTATAPEAVRRDIAAELQLDDPVVVARGFDRANLHFEVVRVVDQDRRNRQLANVLAKGAPGTRKLVYCATRREAEDTALGLIEQGVAASHYHGGMERKLRREIQDAFLSDDPHVEVLCATSAFGMGIDKPDIRMVVHRTLPDSLEAYWQEAGRAGRDGAPADCVLLYRRSDRSVHEHLHRRSRPSEPTVAKMVHLFSQVTTATPADEVLARVARGASVARSGAASLLEDLERYGFLREFKAGVRWRGDPQEAMEAMATHQAKQVEIEQSRLDMVAAFAETSSCRRRYLLNYLGDEYRAELCLRCDNCLWRAQQRTLEDWDEDAMAERVEASQEGPFAPGDTVAHPDWGPGVVQRVEAEILVVRFESVGYRSLHGPTVTERGLLTAQPG